MPSNVLNTSPSDLPKHLNTARGEENEQALKTILSGHNVGTSAFRSRDANRHARHVITRAWHIKNSQMYSVNREHHHTTSSWWRSLTQKACTTYTRCRRVYRMPPNMPIISDRIQPAISMPNRQVRYYTTRTMGWQDKTRRVSFTHPGLNGDFTGSWHSVSLKTPMECHRYIYIYIYTFI